MKILNRVFMKIFMIACLVGMGSLAFAQTPHTHQHGFTGAEQWAKVFDDPARDEWQKPHQVIQALGLKPDSVVADIGSGTGYFAIRLAHMVGKGTVYGVDAEPDMVKYLSNRAQKLGLKNLYSVQGTAESPQLPEKVDLVLFVDVFHHIADRVKYLAAMRNTLNPGGRIAVIDFRMDSPIGPPAAGRIAPGQVIDDFKKAGYSVTQEHDFLPNQYFLIFQ